MGVCKPFHHCYFPTPTSSTVSSKRGCSFKGVNRCQSTFGLGMISVSVISRRHHNDPFSSAQCCTEEFRTVEVFRFLTVGCCEPYPGIPDEVLVLRPVRLRFLAIARCCAPALPTAVGGGSIRNEIPVGDVHRHVRPAHQGQGVDRPAAGHRCY